MFYNTLYFTGLLHLELISQLFSFMIRFLFGVSLILFNLSGFSKHSINSFSLQLHFLVLCSYNLVMSEVEFLHLDKGYWTV